MGLSPQEFILWNGLLVGAIVISFVWIRRSRGPRLYLSSKKQASTPRDRIVYQPRKTGPYRQAEPESPTIRRERGLNLMFNYNGHSWDAYEVLGIPAGSSYVAAQEAFKKVRLTLDADSEKFMEAALESIRKQKE